MFKDFTEFAEPPLQLPYNGKVYTVPPVSIEAGIQLAQVMAGADEYKSKPTEWLWRLVLGPVWDEMTADGVPAAFATRAGLTALTDFQYGRKMAEAAWENGADPKAIEAYLTSQSQGSPPSTTSGAASTTPRRASGTGTRSRKK